MTLLVVQEGEHSQVLGGVQAFADSGKGAPGACTGAQPLDLLASVCYLDGPIGEAEPIEEPCLK